MVQRPTAGAAAARRSAPSGASGHSGADSKGDPARTPSRRGILVGGLALGVVVAAAQWRLGSRSDHANSLVFTDGGYAIRGYDPVAYFRERASVEGSASFVTRWNGADWLFASRANRDAFLERPAAFAPRYGGFCAWAVAVRGELYPTDPDAWSIVDGRLYLNFDGEIQRRWERDIPGFIAAGDRRWPEIVAAA